MMLSYAVYLTRKSVIHIVQGLLSDKLDVNSNVMLLICMVCSLAAALLLNLAVEKLFMRWREKILEEE